MERTKATNTRRIVLLVDDSIPLHKLVKSHLASDAIELHSAYNGDAAIAAAALLQPSLILLDVDLPEMNGFEVCGRLKSNPATAGVPVIFVTADSVVMDKVKGLDLGAADYIVKPFKPDELRARVRASLRAKYELDHTTMVDGLTGLWNRAYMDQYLAGQFSLAKRSGRPIACVVADLDRPAGQAKTTDNSDNDVLRAIARIFLSQCRAEDVVCHLQNGRFTLVLLDSNQSGAAHVADRLRASIASQLKKCGTRTNVTCSFGVADTLVAGDAALLERADDALIRAKKAGGNGVSIARNDDDKVPAAA